MARVKKATGTVTKTERNKDGSTSLYIQPTVRQRLLKDGGESFSRAEARTLDSPPFDPVFSGNMARTLGGINEIHKDIERAVAYHFHDPLVGKVIELMTIFSNDGIVNECKDPKIKEWYDAYCEKINMEQVMAWMFLEYFRSSNVIVARTLSTYEPDDNRMKGAANLPSSYTVLNPTLVFPDGGNAQYADLYLDTTKNDEFVSRMQTNSPSAKQVASDLFVVQNGKIVLKNQRAQLNPFNVKRILRMCQPYEPAARPMMKRAFLDLYLKSKLKEMDLSVINGVIQQIIKVTIGDKDHIASRGQIAQLGAIFSNPTKTMTVVWNHTLQIEVITPGKAEWLDSGKYKEVNENIRSAFGISSVLTGTGNESSGGGNGAYLSIKGFLGNLIEGRQSILAWRKNEYRYIAEKMGHKIIPTPKFRPLALGDEIREKQVIATLVRDAVISRETAIEGMGYDPTTELANLEKESKLRDKGIYPPFQGAAPAGQNGRPVASGDGYPPDRKSSTQKRLKGKANEDVVVSVTGQELNEKGIKNGEQLMNYLKEKVETEVAAFHQEI